MSPGFDPNPGDPIELFEQEYVVQPHPQASYLPYRQKAGRARVYQLRNGQQGEYFALKEFMKLYRTPTLIDSYRNLHRVEDFEGLRAAKRQIILPDDPAAQSYPNLQYAMLMPWIHGTTWFDVLGQAQEGGDYPDLTTAIELCDRFLEIMEGLEKAQMAHTDISPGNIMVGFDPIDVELLDLEEMYMPGVDAPPQQTTGSTGYRHRGGETTWKPEGDRYAAAVLAAEMLILANPDLARRASDKGFFTGHCEEHEVMARFGEARPWLEEVAPEFAKVFDRCWFADSLEGCPSISELREPIKKLAKRPLLPESPKRVETPIARQPSTGSKVALGTPDTPVVGSGPRRMFPWTMMVALIAVITVLALIGLIAWGPWDHTLPVPDLVGQTASAAGLSVGDDFTLEASDSKSSGEPKDTILSQDPKPDERAPQGSTISVITSAGLPVPNLVGQTESAAEGNAGDDFEIEASGERSSSEPKGTILSQDPEPGERAQQGSTISVVLSAGGIIFQDDFSDTSSGWPQAKDPYGGRGNYDASRGTYRLAPGHGGQNHSVIGKVGDIEDAKVEVDAIRTGDTPVSGRWGVVCRESRSASNKTNHYRLGISNDGSLLIAKVREGTPFLIKRRH